MNDHSVFTGLGQRGAESSPPADEEEPLSEFERGTQRTVPASPFDHPYRRSAGSAATPDDASAATPKKTEPRMSKKPEGAPRAVRNVQLRICRAIEAAGGTILRTDLAKALPDLDTKQISQGIFQVTASSRAQKHMTDAGWTLKLGRAGTAFLQVNGTSEDEAAAPPKNTPRRKPKEAPAPAKKPRRRAKAQPKAPRKKPKARRAAVRVHRAAAPARSLSEQLALSEPARIQVVQERSFRCAVYSDGGFFLAKGDQKVELTAAEHREMLRYQERMCEPAAS